jgi:hypothetical protein
MMKYTFCVNASSEWIGRSSSKQWKEPKKCKKEEKKINRKNATWKNAITRAHKESESV